MERTIPHSDVRVDGSFYRVDPFEDVHVPVVDPGRVIRHPIVIEHGRDESAAM